MCPVWDEKKRCENFPRFQYRYKATATLGWQLNYNEDFFVFDVFLALPLIWAFMMIAVSWDGRCVRRGWYDWHNNEKEHQGQGQQQYLLYPTLLEWLQISATINVWHSFTDEFGGVWNYFNINFLYSVRRKKIQRLSGDDSKLKWPVPFSFWTWDVVVLVWSKALPNLSTS